MNDQKKRVWKFTHVHHPARIALKVTLNQYCVLDLIYQSQVHPKFSVEGWSDRSYQKIASFLGLQKSTVHAIVERSVIEGFAEYNLENVRLKRTTENWFDYAYLEEITEEDIDIIHKRSENERSENERKRSENERKRSENERKRSENERYNKDNKDNKDNKLHYTSKNGFESSEDVKNEISKLNLPVSDNPEGRLKMLAIYELWILEESFLVLWRSYADRCPDVKPQPLMKVWVNKAAYYDVKNVKVNLIQGWIAKAQEGINKLKNAKNGKSRNHKNLQSADNARSVFERLQSEGI